MRHPSLNSLYFETLSLPSSPAVWIGCSLALHVGICLFPLGGSNQQKISFAPGDAGVQVELVAEAEEAAPPVSESTPLAVEFEPMPIAQIELPKENDVVIAEPEAKPQPVRKVAATKTRTQPNNSKPSESVAAGGGARAGSAAAQPAAQIFTTQPPYPQGARDSGAEGDVRLRVRVAPDGSARAVEIARSSGRADFDSSSISTVKREWRFRPARTVSGAPIESTVTVAIHFNLRS